MTSVVGALLYILLLALSQEFVKTGAPVASYFQTADAVINAGIGWFRDVAMLLTFGIGALMYYVVFYQYRLVPRWLSVWVSGPNHIDHHQCCVGDVPCHLSLLHNPDYFPNADHAARNGAGGLADRERIQSIGCRFRICKNSDERTFKRCIDWMIHGTGRAERPANNPPLTNHKYSRQLV